VPRLSFTGLRAVVRAALFCLAVLLLFEYDRVRRFELGLRIVISFGFCGITCRHHRSPTSAIKPAGQDRGTRLSTGTGHTTALFVQQSQSFLDNVIAGLGQS